MKFSVFIWDKYPFLRYTILLIIGITLSIYAEFTLNLISIFGIIFTISLQIFFNFKNNIFNILSIIYIIFFGFLLHQVFNEKTYSNIPFHSNFIGKIADFTEIKNGKLKTIIQVNKLINQQDTNEVNFKTVVYLPLQNTQNLSYGDIISCKGNIFNMPPSESKYTFDFAKYWANQYIYFQSYPKSSVLIEKGNDFNIFRITTQLRNYCDNIFKKNIRSPNEYAFVTAMILGIRNHIDVDLKDAYSKTGVIHVIAISGLHISLFFFIINGIFSKIFKSKKVVAGIVLITIWIYGLMTGLSPSVMRAVIMHSVILIGVFLNRKTNLINNLSLSAFILLIINPNNLIDIGFQLTFVAVFGIAIFNNLKPNKPLSDNYFINYFFEIVSLTLVAQLSLIPLLIYYFHSFSLSFLIANLAIIPLSNFIIYESLAMLIGHFFGNYITKIIASIIYYNTQLMNQLALIFSKIPYSNINSIFFTKIDCALLYCIIISIVYYFKIKSKNIIIVITCFVIAFTINRFYEYWSHQNQSLLISYSFKNRTMICNIHGFNANIYTSNIPDYYQSKTIESTFNLSFVTLNQKHLLSDNFKEENVFSNSDYLLLNFRTEYFIILKSAQVPIFKEKIKYIQVINNLKFEWNQLIDNYKHSIVVIDKSNSYHYAQKLDSYLTKRGLKVHNMYKSGALVIE